MKGQGREQGEGPGAGEQNAGPGAGIRVHTGRTLAGRERTGHTCVLGKSRAAKQKCFSCPHATSCTHMHPPMSAYATHATHASLFAPCMPSSRPMPHHVVPCSPMQSHAHLGLAEGARASPCHNLLAVLLHLAQEETKLFLGACQNRPMIHHPKNMSTLKPPTALPGA